MKNVFKIIGIAALVAAIGFSVIACDNGAGGGTHQHQWGAWQSNATQHWKECSCGEEYGRANHTGSPCSVCGYTGTTPPTPTQSLNGVWAREGNPNVQVTVNGSTGLYSSIGFTSALSLDAVSKDYISIGSQHWRNLTSTGALTWSGQELGITFNTSRPDVATGTTWVNVTFTLSADGQTLTSTGTFGSGGTSTRTWTRSSHSLNGVWAREGNPNVQVTVSGSTGLYSSIGFTSAFSLDAVSKDYISIGGQHWRNLTSTGTLTWSGQELGITFNTSRPDVATGTTWVNCTFTLSADGQTLTRTGTFGSGGTTTTTWIRMQ